jgi:hypothetical protein
MAMCQNAGSGIPIGICRLNLQTTRRSGLTKIVDLVELQRCSRWAPSFCGQLAGWLTSSGYQAPQRNKRTHQTGPTDTFFPPQTSHTAPHHATSTPVTEPSILLPTGPLPPGRQPHELFFARPYLAVVRRRRLNRAKTSYW